MRASSDNARTFCAFWTEWRPGRFGWPKPDQDMAVPLALLEPWPAHSNLLLHHERTLALTLTLQTMPPQPQGRLITTRGPSPTGPSPSSSGWRWTKQGGLSG